MEVRPTREDEAPALARVLAITAQEPGLVATEPPVDVAALTTRFERLARGEGGAAWTLEDGAPVGALGLHDVAAGVLDLGMALLPAARGRGGGRRLLRTAVGAAPAMGAHKITLEVWPSNGRAVALYASEGFVVEGLRRAHRRRRDGTLWDALLMARLL